MPVTPDKLTREHIEAALLAPGERGMHAVGRALQALLQKQTPDEIGAKEVHHDNGMGFTPFDAGIGTDNANFYRRRGFLTRKQLDVWQKPSKSNPDGKPRILKYVTQLLKIAEEKHPELVKEARVIRRRRKKENEGQPELEI